MGAAFITKKNRLNSAFDTAGMCGSAGYSAIQRGIWGLFATKKNSLRRCCVFNKARESFLSLNIAVADTHLTRLRGLMGRLRLKSDEGIWVIPSRGVHTIGVLFAIDLIYLDANYRVVHLVESFGTFRIGPVRTNCCSVLELPTRTIYSSQTQLGDELLICSPEEMEEFLRDRDRKAQYRAASG